jgi:hypothetical protein
MSHLDELSELLGVRVTDVRGIYVWTEGRGRPTTPNAWILTLADGRESPPLHSDRLRDVWGLNRWAHVGGGPRPCPS